MPRLPAILVLACGVLAGCLDHCGPTYMDLRWDDPGLYPALDAAKPGNATWAPGKGSLPWNGSAWAAAPYPGIRLAQVGFVTGGGRAGQVRNGIFLGGDDHPLVSGVAIADDGLLRVGTEGDVPDARLRAAFDAVLANATEGIDEEAAWTAFLASKTDTGALVAVPKDADGREFEEYKVWSYQASLRGHLRLDALAARLGLAPPADWGFAEGSATAGPWTFTFGLPTWTVAGSPGRLRVDAAGHADFDEVAFPDEQDIRDAAQATLARVGRTADLSGANPTASIC